MKIVSVESPMRANLTMVCLKNKRSIEIIVKRYINFAVNCLLTNCKTLNEREKKNQFNRGGDRANTHSAVKKCNINFYD